MPGELEREYLSLFDRFAAMIADGSFPYSGPVADSTRARRGSATACSIVDADARVRYLSPNANSAMHRVGIHANAVGHAPRRARLLRRRRAPGVRDAMPVVEEFEQAADVVLLCRCMPILSADEVRRRGAARCATSPTCASATAC